MIKPLFLVCGIAAGATALMQAGALPGSKDSGKERTDEKDVRYAGIESVVVERAGGSLNADGTILSTTEETGADAEEIEWLTVSLDTPGELGVEILYQVDVLSDVKNLRVIGKINSDDWTTIKNIPGLVNLDLSQAETGAVPDEQFYQRSSLKSIQLPDGLLSIGTRAFRESGLTTVEIPSTVTYIWDYAFYNTALVTVEFGEDSELIGMGQYAFAYCRSLTEIALPDGVTQIPQYAFYYDSSLKSVKLPAMLTSIGGYAFERTTVLDDIEFPETLRSISSAAFSNSGIKSAILPMNLTTLGSSAFYYCQNLKEVRLSGVITNFGSNSPFSNCNNIERIVCPVALPPKYDGNTPFSVSLGNVELVVPDFAVVSYKLDSYWKNAGTITGGVSADSYLIAGTLSLSNNRRIDGTPALTLQAGSVLSVGGNAPMEMTSLVFNHDWYEPYYGFTHSQLIDNCGAITAETVSSSYRMYYNRWHFFSLPFETTLERVRHEANMPFALRYYDGANRAQNGTGSNWKDVTEDMVIPRGTGLIIQTNQSGWLTFDATADGIAEFLNGEGVVMPLAANLAEQENASAANIGWNYVGNPYQTYYDMYYTMLTAPITVWNHYESQYEAYSLIDENVVLHPSQSFFIQATEELSEIPFVLDGRQSNNAVNHVAPRRLAAESGRALFNLSLGAGESSDRTRVVLNEQASLDYEPARDASKFFSEAAAIYTIDGEGNALAINERPADNGEVRLGIRVNTPGDYSISAGRIDGIARLTDLQTGAVTLLEDGVSYEFHAEEAGEIDNRFVLSVSAPIGTGISDVADAGRLSVTAEAGGILVEGAAGELIAVYTPSGAVAAMAVGEAESRVQLEPGLYIVKVGNARAVKVIVK